MASDLRAFSTFLFDFDGTLADSFEAIANSVNHIRSLHGLPALPTADVTRFVGRGPYYLLEHTVPGADLEEAIAEYRRHHPTVMVALTRLLPGAAEAVKALHRFGKHVGLCSNKPRNFSFGLLQHFGIFDCFALILGPEDVKEPKPAPEMIEKAVARLGVEQSEVLYTGDMTVDIETGRAAGVHVWAVATGSQDRATLEKARPDRVLAGLGEMVAELGAE